MSRILVTGASGFLGRAVIAAFAKDGHAVRAAVRQTPVPPFAAGIEVATHRDYVEGFDWPSLLDGMDFVVHLAGIAHTGPGIDPALYDRVNRRATEEVANAAARDGIQRFVFVSSIRAQCGPAADHVLSERDPPQPTDPYGRSKLAAEAEVQASGVPFTILRPVLLYGRGVKGNFATLVRAARSPWPLPVKQFTNRRSFLGTDNFVSALSFVLSRPDTAGEIYVVADPGPAPTLCELIATLRKGNGRRPLLLPLPTALVEKPLRLMGRRDLWMRLGGDLRADPAKLIAAGWLPLHDTRSGLMAMVRSGAGGA
jgi:nucleoside-diphosphate-sugar epimerase